MSCQSNEVTAWCWESENPNQGSEAGETGQSVVCSLARGAQGQISSTMVRAWGRRSTAPALRGRGRKSSVNLVELVSFSLSLKTKVGRQRKMPEVSLWPHTCTTDVHGHACPSQIKDGVFGGGGT